MCLFSKEALPELGVKSHKTAPPETGYHFAEICQKRGRPEFVF